MMKTQEELLQDLLEEVREIRRYVEEKYSKPLVEETLEEENE